MSLWRGGYSLSLCARAQCEEERREGDNEPAHVFADARERERERALFPRTRDFFVNEFASSLCVCERMSVLGGKNVGGDLVVKE